MLKHSSTLSTKKVGANKLVLGFAALAATAIIGATGISAAAGATPASGYGNNIQVGVNVNGNNNIIQIIINIFR